MTWNQDGISVFSFSKKIRNEKESKDAILSITRAGLRENASQLQVVGSRPSLPQGSKQKKDGLIFSSSIVMCETIATATRPKGQRLLQLDALVSTTAHLRE